MCGRFALARCPDEVTRIFDLAECADFTPRYNIAPATDIPVIRRSPTQQNVLHLLRWGLVPHWSKDPTSGSPLINARSESLTEKPSSLDHKSAHPGGQPRWGEQNRTGA